MPRSIADQTVQELGGRGSVLARHLVDAGARRAPDRLAPVGRAVSSGLAAVAGIVERVPLSRGGDRPPTSR